MGDWENALRHLRKCLELEESLWVRHLRSQLPHHCGSHSRVQGANNRHSADTVFNMGVTAELSGDPAGARPLFQRALDIYRKHLAPDHPAILRTQQRMADLR